MLLEVNCLGKRNLNLKYFKQKFNGLHATHYEFFDLLKHIGIGWDVETNVIHALKGTWKKLHSIKKTSKLVIFYFKYLVYTKGGVFSILGTTKCKEIFLEGMSTLQVVRIDL